MNDLLRTPASPGIYHHHWLAYWAPLAGVALLVVLGVSGLLFWVSFGLVLWSLALLVSLGIYLHRSWHTLNFTPDNRLCRRHGFLGTRRDVISLFGVVTPYQTPILGRLLDVGGVYLGIPGPDIHIRHIASFHAFQFRLMNGTQRHKSHSDPSVQVVIQLLHQPRSGGNWSHQVPIESRERLSAYSEAIWNDRGDN